MNLENIALNKIVEFLVMVNMLILESLRDKQHFLTIYFVIY